MDQDNTVDIFGMGVSDDAALSQPAEAAETAEQPDEGQGQQQGQKQASEPGWMRLRVDSAVKRAEARLEERLRAEYEAQLTPMREMYFSHEADSLVASGEFKTRERALEYVRLKNAAPAPEVSKPAAQTRDERGRFAAQGGGESAVEARASELYRQAQGITALGGPDVMKEYQTNPEAQRRVNSGEWSFFDVAQNMGARKPPVPARTPNGAYTGDIDIASMTDEQFDRFNAELRKGGRLMLK